MAEEIMDWSEVEQSDKFQMLPEIQKSQMQQDYFNEVVAPKTGPGELEEARRDFLNEFPRVSRQRGRTTAISPKAQDIVAVSRALGVDPKQVDTETGAKFLDRLDYSFSDTDEEVANKFGRKYETGTMVRITMPDGRTRLAYQETPESKWTTVEDYGLSLGDIADVGGEATMLSASIAAGMATGGSSVVIQMLAYGGGYAGGYLVKEAIEEIRGTQLQTGKEVGMEALTRYGVAAGGVGVAAVGSKIVTTMGRRGLAGGAERSQLMDDVIKARETGAEFETLMAGQQIPEQMAVSRLEAQAVSTTKSAQEKLARQRGSAKLVLEKTKGVEFTEYAAGKKVLTETKKIYDKEYNRLVNELGRATPRQTEGALQKTVEDFLANTKTEIDELYKTTGDIAAIERPIFNLAEASKGGASIRTAVMGEGKDIERLIAQKPAGGYGFAQAPVEETAVTAGPGVQVAQTPTGELNAILDKIDKLKNVQVNYEVIKQLRTQTGDLIEKFPWDANFNKGQAKKLYGILTDTIENPVNSAKKFVASHKISSSKAKARFDVMDKSSIQQIVKNETTGSLINTLSKPNSITPDIQKVLQSRYVKQSDFKRFKTGVVDQIVLDEQGSIKAIENFRRADPEAWRFLVPKKDESRVMNIAREIDKLKQSNIGQLAKSDARALNAVDNLLAKEGTSKADINAIVDAFSGEGREALRLASFEDIIAKTAMEVKGVQTVDKKILGQVIARYKKSGIWDRVLTKDDRIKIQGLKSYLDLIFWRGADPGVSLEAAQAITNLKHPATFFTGVHQLGVNKVMAHVLMSKTGSKLFLGSPKVNVRKEPLIILEAIVKGLSEGTELGSGVAAEEQMLTP